jgi:hypothetical protein
MWYCHSEFISESIINDKEILNQVQDDRVRSRFDKVFTNLIYSQIQATTPRRAGKDSKSRRNNYLVVL